MPGSEPVVPGVLGALLGIGMLVGIWTLTKPADPRSRRGRIRRGCLLGLALGLALFVLFMTMFILDFPAQHQGEMPRPDHRSCLYGGSVCGHDDELEVPLDEIVGSIVEVHPAGTAGQMTGRAARDQPRATQQ